MKKILIIIFSFILLTGLTLAKSVPRYSSEEEVLSFVSTYEKILNFSENYEAVTKKVIKDMESYDHSNKKVKINIGISISADGILIGTASGKSEHVQETIVFYGKASVIKEYVPKIKKTSTDKVFLANFIYDGSDQLEELHYGNRSYVKIKEDLDELVKKGVLKKIDENEYENKYGVTIIIVGIPNEYPPAKGLYTHLYSEYIDGLLELIDY